MRSEVKHRVNEILEMNAQGKTLDEIAEVIGCSKEGVSYQLKKHGVAFNKKIKEFTQGEIQTIKSMYALRKYPKEIADTLGVTRSRVYLTMEKLGMDTSSNFFRKEEYNEVVSLYNSGMSLEDISKVYGCYRQAVENLFKKLDIKCRTKKQTKDLLYPVNKNCFTDWKDEKTLYFYGILLSDGCIMDDGKVSLSFAYRDLKTLQDFKDYIGSENKIYIDENQSCCSFAFKDHSIASNLRLAGLEPRKSTIEKFPLTVDRSDTESARHFWRGFICGDGSVRPTGGCPSLFICGSYEICSEFKSFCENVLGFALKNSVKENSATAGFYYFRISGRKARDVSTFIFDNQSICMERKLEDVVKMKHWTPLPKYHAYGVYKQKDNTYGVVFFPTNGNKILAKFDKEEDAIAYRLNLELNHYGYHKSLS